MKNATLNQLYVAIVTEANDRAAELGRDLLSFGNDTMPDYVIAQTSNVRTLRIQAMEVLDMLEGIRPVDAKRIKEIRNYAAPDVSKTLVGY